MFHTRKPFSPSAVILINTFAAVQTASANTQMETGIAGAVLEQKDATDSGIFLRSIIPPGGGGAGPAGGGSGR